MRDLCTGLWCGHIYSTPAIQNVASRTRHVAKGSATGAGSIAYTIGFIPSARVRSPAILRPDAMLLSNHAYLTRNGSAKSFRKTRKGISQPFLASCGMIGGTGVLLRKSRAFVIQASVAVGDSGQGVSKKVNDAIKPGNKNLFGGCAVS